MLSVAWDRDGIDPHDVNNTWVVNYTSMAKLNITGYEGLKQKRIDLSNLTALSDPIYANIYASGLQEKTQYIDADAIMPFA